MIIDFSAHDTWDFCPAAWYEKYVNKRRKKWEKAQRDDALALGSLVHEGLRIWQQQHIVQIPNAVIEEVTPTPECLNLAQELVYGYARAYPEERWPLVVCEEPLQMPLLTVPTWDGEVGEDLTLLAKIDTYFYNPELTTVESGVEGLTFTLSPGWWIHEYKTKSPYIPIGLYMKSWQMGMQATYQTLALRHHLRETLGSGDEVQGILVNVLEKPIRRPPMRKCGECKESYEFYRWLPTGTGLYACPECGTRRKILPLKEAPPVVPPSYYRVCVTRDERQLLEGKDEIVKVGQEMIQMAAGGLTSEAWRHKNCVDFKWKSTCQYFVPHSMGGSTVENTVDYEEIPDYRGLVQIEEPV